VVFRLLRKTREMSKYQFNVTCNGEKIFEDREKEIPDIYEVWNEIHRLSDNFTVPKEKANQTNIRVYDDEGHILISVGLKAATCLTHHI